VFFKNAVIICLKILGAFLFLKSTKKTMEERNKKRLDFIPEKTWVNEEHIA